MVYYPAIDLLQSNSKMATPTIIGERHYLLWHRRSARRWRITNSLKDIISMLGMEQLSPDDRAKSLVAPAGWSGF